MTIQPTNQQPLTQFAGIKKVSRLYIQLAYLCNFNCQHCYHGDKLKLKHAFTKEEVISIANLFRQEYQTHSITFLGGEPFLHPQFDEILQWSKEQGFRTEVVSNGFKIEKRLLTLHSYIDMLRISIDGLEEANDIIRRKGSFQEALHTLNTAQFLGLSTSVTLTVTRLNIKDVVPMGQLLKRYGVTSLKLHRLRPVGNASSHPELFIEDENQYSELVRDLIQNKETMIPVIYDADLDPFHISGSGGEEQDTELALERVEIEPNGALYLSCKAVGNNCNAFVFNELRNRILYSPKENDEIMNPVKQVFYSKT